MSTQSTITEDESAAEQRKVLIAVCTLNEAENIVSLIGSMRKEIPSADILIVDDQSPDGTADLVRENFEKDHHVILKVRENQKGLGGAIRFAMQHAVDSGYDFFMNLDGDFSHDPMQLPHLLSRIECDSDLDVVIGSRYAEGGKIVGWPLHRKWMSWLINRFAVTCLGLPVSDCSGSMRCYRVEALVRVNLQSLRVNGYAVLEEILLKLVQQGSRLSEVPITFTERQKGASKLTFREACRSCGQLLRMAWQR